MFNLVFLVNESCLNCRIPVKSSLKDAVKALEKGQEITEDSVKSIRPGFGLPPKYLKDIVGKYVSKRVEAGDRVEWASIS